MEIDKLIPYHNNMLKHGDEQVDILASIIADGGFDVPIVVDDNNVIIKGHGRKLAAIKLGMEKVPVIVRDDLTPEQVRSMRISDNAISYKSEVDPINLSAELARLSAENYNLSLTGYNEDEIQMYLESYKELNVSDYEEDDKKINQNKLPDPGDAPKEKYAEQWGIIVNCLSEEHQVELLEKFNTEGIKCRAFIS